MARLHNSFFNPDCAAALPMPLFRLREAKPGILAALTLSLVACGQPRPSAPPRPPDVVLPKPPLSPTFDEVAGSSSDGAAPCRQNGKCRVEGLCALEGTTCVADSDKSCRRSLVCDLFGRCKRFGDGCFATDAWCRSSLACRLHGYCSLNGDFCDREPRLPPSDESTILSPAMRHAMDRPFDAAWIVGRWEARPPGEGADSYTWQADLEVQADGSFELTEGEVYPDKHPCTLAGDVRIADFVMIQRVSRSTCLEIPPGTLRSFAVFPEADEFGLKELFIRGSDRLRATGYRRADPHR